MANTNKPSVYFIPVYAAGHLISMVELAKRLLQLASSDFSIHFIIMLPDDPAKGSPLCSSYLQSLQTNDTPIQFHILPSIEPLSSFDGIIELEALRLRSYLPHIKASLLASASPVSAVVFDSFASDVIDIANELNIPSYVYYAANATTLSLLFHLSSQEGESDQKDFSEMEELCAPGLLPTTCLPGFFSDRKSASYKWLMHHTRRISEAKAVIFNSNIYLEKLEVEALKEGTLLTHGKKLPDMYPIGPVIASGEEMAQEHECLKWLDKQPMRSVVFLCFGSMGAFDVMQSRQIASALEQSGYRFLWVLRSPSKEFLR